ncbi:MAG TPA: DUF4012 domain-containing protein [Anaerolineae bacterium]|nr:DUF4012 domain-containing protein [Anaerolineae bacterium]
MKIISFRAKQALSKEQQPSLVRYYLGHVFIYAGFLIIALVIGWLVLEAQRIYTSYRAATQHLATLEALASAGQPSLLPSFLQDGPEGSSTQLEESIHGTATELETLYQAVTPFLPLTPYLGWLPVYGGDLQASPYLLAAGRDLSRAGAILFDDFSPALQPNARQSGPLPNFVASMTEARAEIDQAEALLQQAQVNIGQVEIERLSPQVADRVAPLKQYLPQAISAMQMVKGLPGLLGAKSPQTYLIVTQNSDELRPSGGYINAAGHIVFDQGQIVEFVMQDSYAVDRLSEQYPYPPDPLYQYMGAEYWVLRDAGWSPDFPSTARNVIYLYQLGQGISANGVIALDQQALPYLLQALGPIEVEGERVTSGNVVKLMRQHWAPEQGQKLNQEWWQQRKSFMLSLAETVRQKFEQDFGSVNLPVLADVWQQALAEKHILIYLANPTWADVLAQKNWAGLLHPTQGDYLMVVDANVGFNKVNALVERRLNYQVTLAEDGSAQAHANLVYQHHAQNHLESCRQEIRYDRVYEQNMEHCYWNYMRLIVPAAAQLGSGPRVIVDGQALLRGQPTTGEIDVTSPSADKLSWGQLFVLAPKNSISLDYIYTLPPGTAHAVDDHWQYNLFLQKQPGTLAPTVEVVVTLPERGRLLKSQPEPLSQQERVITYLVSLKTDQEIELSYHLP